MEEENSCVDISLNEFKRARLVIDKSLRGIRRSDKIAMGGLLSLINDVLGLQIRSHQVRHLISRQIIYPEPQKNDQGHYLFGWTQIVDILLFYRFEGVPRIRLLALFREEAEEKIRKLEETHAGSIHLPYGQVKRSFMFWRSNLMMVFLSSLFNGSVPREARLALRKDLDEDPALYRGAPVFRFDRSDDYRSLLDITTSTEGDIQLITTSDREVLHLDMPEEEWNGCCNVNYEWYLFELGLKKKPSLYKAVIVVPTMYHDELTISDKKTVNAALLARVLKAFFFNEEDIPLPLYDVEPFSTRLQILVDLIPTLSSSWDFSTIFVPDPERPDTLKSVAISQGVLKEEALGGFRVSRGELLSGWVLEENRIAVIKEKASGRDPRCVESFEGEYHSAVAVPTIGPREPNGVLFVGAVQEADIPLFDDADLLFLRILGAILGNLIELENLRGSLRQTSISILGAPELRISESGELRDALETALKRIPSDPAAIYQEDSLHLIAIRMENLSTIKKLSAPVSLWSKDQILYLAQQFCIEKRLGNPQIFPRASSNELVLLIDRIRLSDDEERELRSELRENLNTLELYFEPGKMPTRVKCELWSLPFRHNLLVSEISRARNGASTVANRLSSTIDQVFLTLTPIQLGHEYDWAGNPKKSLEQFEIAEALYPDSAYIKRHKAKALTKLGKHEAASKIWEALVEASPHPSLYSRLAYDYACMSLFDRAEENYQLALQLNSEDPRSFEELANVFTQRGSFKEAISNYLKASSLDKINAHQYQLRIAQARLKSGEYDEARRACSNALSYRPEDREILYWMMIISAMINRTSQP